MQNEIGAEMAYLEANKLNQAAAIAMARVLREEELAKERREKGETEETESDGHKGTKNKWRQNYSEAKLYTAFGTTFETRTYLAIHAKLASVSVLTIFSATALIFVLLNKLRCHALFNFSPDQIT